MPQKSALLPQLLVAFCATLGAYSFGITLGYSSPAGLELTDEDFDDKVHLTSNENSFFSSVLNIGALVGGPLGGLMMNMLGRKNTMLLSVIPFVGSWVLIGFGQNFGMLLSGRVFAGLGAGITTAVVPTYIGEIAAPEYRGLLGTGFQLMVCLGILHAYIFGTFCSWRYLTIAGIVPCCIYGALMLFQSESVQYLISKGKKEEAKKFLQKLRGKDYDIEEEMKNTIQSVEEAGRTKTSFAELKKPWIYKPMMIAISTMIFQQLCGINAVLFNLAGIFGAAGSTLDENTCSIIVGAVQVLATCVAAGLMDKAGRKLLLIISAAVMAVSLVVLGVFFYLKEQDPIHTADTLGWLPLVSLIVFIFAFSIGYGPIPWVLMGDLFDPSVKGLAGGLSAASNWTMSFIVTSVFEPLRTGINDYGVYWMFAGICVVNAVFCFFVIYETKGKTLDEILSHYGAPPREKPKEENGVENPAYEGGGK